MLNIFRLIATEFAYHRTTFLHLFDPIYTLKSTHLSGRGSVKKKIGTFRRQLYYSAIFIIAFFFIGIFALEYDATGSVQMEHLFDSPYIWYHQTAPKHMWAQMDFNSIIGVFGAALVHLTISTKVDHIYSNLIVEVTPGVLIRKQKRCVWQF